MSRTKKRSASGSGCHHHHALFKFSPPVFGLYKCFSQEPTPRPTGRSAGHGPFRPPRSRRIRRMNARPLSSEERKEHFYPSLMAGLDDENGGSDNANS